MNELVEAEKWLRGEVLGDGDLGDGRGDGRDPEQRIEDASEAIHYIAKAKFLVSEEFHPEVGEEVRREILAHAQTLTVQAHTMMRTALGELAAEKISW